MPKVEEQHIITLTYSNKEIMEMIKEDAARRLGNSPSTIKIREGIMGDCVIDATPGVFRTNTPRFLPVDKLERHEFSKPFEKAKVDCPDCGAAQGFAHFSDCPSHPKESPLGS